MTKDKCHHWVSLGIRPISFSEHTGDWQQCDLPVDHDGIHRTRLSYILDIVVTWHYLDNELLYWTGLAVTRHMCITVDRNLQWRYFDGTAPPNK